MTALSAARIASEITHKYGHLQCMQCAEELRDELIRANLKGSILKLEASAKHTRGWIYMRNDQFQFPFAMKPGQKWISDNGTHYGVEVFGTVYDNIFRNGISRADWPLQFESAGELICSTYQKF